MKAFIDAFADGGMKTPANFESVDTLFRCAAGIGLKKIGFDE
jgi:hypothetical protein